MRLVGDDDDVRAIAEQRMLRGSILGEELLDRGEDHAARGLAQDLLQILAALGLLGRLPQQFVTS